MTVADKLKSMVKKSLKRRKVLASKQGGNAATTMIE